MFPVTTKFTVEFKFKKRFAHIIRLLYVVPPLPDRPEMQRKVKMKWTGPGGLPKEKRLRALKEVWYLFWLKELTESREMAQDKKMACVGKKEGCTAESQPRQGHENNGGPADAHS